MKKIYPPAVHKALCALDFALIFLIGALYIVDGFISPGSPEKYKMLLGAIGLTATLSALAFRAAGATREETRKMEFTDAAERLFQSVILFTLATILRYVYSEAGTFNLGATGTLVVQVLVMIPSLFMFFYGLYLAVTALSKANGLLTK
ncbi:MAG: hypothetical protein KJ726_08305 [Verrucomicrobia bacterium]|nr:hypothetical protein [Verrucomicrobiota bacterium]